MILPFPLSQHRVYSALDGDGLIQVLRIAMKFRRTTFAAATTAVAIFSGCSLSREVPLTDSVSPNSHSMIVAAAPSVLLKTPALLPAKSIVFNSEAEPLFPEVEIPDTPEVNRFVRSYNNERRGCVRDGQERRREYEKVVSEVFERYGLPRDLIHVALIESGFQPQARSNKGAVGMWQFIAGTARQYGLLVTGRVDERKDVEKATEAAARHLVQLYQNYQDWSLTLAAYNSGPGTVNKAISATGSRDFFELARRGYFHRETVEYVSRFMAVALIHRDIRPYVEFQEPVVQLAQAEVRR